MKAYLFGFQRWYYDKHLCYILSYGETEQEAREKAANGQLTYNSGEPVKPEELICYTVL